MTSVFMPELKAGEKTIAFSDFSYYWIADREGRTFRRLGELYAQTASRLHRLPACRRQAHPSGSSQGPQAEGNSMIVAVEDFNAYSKLGGQA